MFNLCFNIFPVEASSAVVVKDPTPLLTEIVTKMIQINPALQLQPHLLTVSTLTSALHNVADTMIR